MGCLFVFWWLVKKVLIVVDVNDGLIGFIFG